MPRACSICSHPERLAIDTVLFGSGTDNGTTLRDIAGQFGVARSSLQRHKEHARVVGQPGAEHKGRGAKPEGPDAGQAVRESTQPAADLPPKKQRYLEGRIAGQSKRKAALAAGYSEAMASHASTKIETKDVRQAFAALIRETIPPERITKAISEGLDAMETKFFSSEGEVKDSRDVIAWSERRQYAELAASWGGYHVPDKGDREQGGGVILILPDSPRPAPIIEAKVVDVPSEAGPMLILPDASGERTDA